MQNIKSKHVVLSCLAIAGAVASCVTKDPWVFFWTAVIVGLNID